MSPSGYWFLVIAGTLSLGLWRTGFWLGSKVRAKASIELDLSIADRPNGSARSLASLHRKHGGTLSRYMLELYRRRPEADVVKALRPVHISGPNADGERVLEFSVPSAESDESLSSAEILAVAGTICRVRSPAGDLGIVRSRREDLWRAFDVTSAVKTGKTKLFVSGRSHRPPDSPILLLNYRKTRKRRRRRRSADDEDEERWEEEHPRRRRRNGCRRRPLYVDFALIAYDEWVVAPPGYEAYQCTGKCFYPFPDHLSPTKHAIIQTLVHGALKGISENKPGRACCVPTRLAPISLLYLDASGTLTYQYGYEDMVVAECGCR